MSQAHATTRRKYDDTLRETVDNRVSGGMRNNLTRLPLSPGCFLIQPPYSFFRPRSAIAVLRDRLIDVVRRSDGL